VEEYSGSHTPKFMTHPLSVRYDEPWLECLAKPMFRAFWYHKQRRYLDAYQELERVQGDDWRIAGKDWLTKRQQVWRRREQQHATASTDQA
jgi:hypothetical protein